MSNDRLVNVSKERQVNTYAEMWHTSRCLLDAGERNREGSTHQFRASLVFTAFTLEAFLNHIGPKLFECWDDLETLRPRPKLNIVCERLGVIPEYSRRPWQVVKHLFVFRNDIAHGKSAIVKSSAQVLASQVVDDFHFLPTKWEAYATQRNAIRAREDVDKIIRTLFDAGDFPGDSPYWHGLQSGMVVAVSE